MIKKILADDVEVTEKNIKNWIKYFIDNIQPQRIKMGKYYDGLNDILKMGAVSGRPNYRVNVNLAKYVTDVATSYFIGKPVQYTEFEGSASNNELELLNDINKKNHEQDVNFEVAGDASVYGVGYQLCYINSEKESTIKCLDAENTFIVYSGDVEELPICAIYIVPKISFEAGAQSTSKVYVYTNEEILEFDYANGNLSNKIIETNLFKKIPIIEFKNNDDLVGDFEPVTDLIDAICLSTSNMTDDLQSIANAILAITGGKLDEANIALLNKTKVANLPEGATMDWVIKNINPEATKEHIQRCLNFLFQVAQVPDLTDEAFGGNISGIAMKYKIWGLKQLFATKVAKFKRALYERMQTILNYESLKNQTTYDIMNKIDINFFENTPETLSSDLEVAKLKGIISDLTLFKNMEIVDNPEVEMQEITDEEAAKLDTYNAEVATTVTTV